MHAEEYPTAAEVRYCGLSPARLPSRHGANLDGCFHDEEWFGIVVSGDQRQLYPRFRNVLDPFGRGPYGLYGRTEIPQRSGLLPYLGVLSFRSEAPGGIGTATPRVHHAHRLGNSMAARGEMSGEPSSIQHQRCDRRRIAL